MEDTKPIFVGSTFGEIGLVTIPLGLMLVLILVVVIPDVISGNRDWTLIGGLVFIAALFLRFAIPTYVLSWRYEFYEDNFQVKHRGKVETFRYSDIAAWQAAKHVPMAFHRRALRIEVVDRKDEVTLDYVPYNRRLRTYLSEFLDKKVPDKRV